MSASDPRIHFGLGKRTKIESLEITWPSGQVDKLTNLAPDQIIAVKEGAGIVSPSTIRRKVSDRSDSSRSIELVPPAPFSRLFPSRSRQHAARSAHNSALEME